MSYIPTIQGTAVYTATGKKIIDEPKAVPAKLIDMKRLDARTKEKGWSDRAVSMALFGKMETVKDVRDAIKTGTLSQKRPDAIRKAFMGYEPKVEKYIEDHPRRLKKFEASAMSVEDVEHMLAERGASRNELVRHADMGYALSYVDSALRTAQAGNRNLSKRVASVLTEMFRRWDEDHGKNAMPGELYKGEFYEEKQEDMKNTATAIPGGANKTEEREETAKVEKQNFYDALMGTRLIVHCRRRALTELNKEDTDELSFRKGLDAMADAIIAYLEMMEEER